MKIEENIGRKFCRLTVLRIGPKLYRRFQSFVCVCECGKEKTIAACNVINGRSKSCGCLLKDFNIQERTTHGRSRTKVHWAWKHIKARCLNTTSLDYPNYGGAGITICDKWKDSFAAFYRDMGDPPSPKHSVDRINNALGYEPGNCRWATYTQQNRNRRCARYYTAFGETKHIIEWSKDSRCRTSYENIGQRIRKGWDIEVAISTPTQGK